MSFTDNPLNSNVQADSNSSSPAGFPSDIDEESNSGEKPSNDVLSNIEESIKESVTDKVLSRLELDVLVNKTSRLNKNLPSSLQVIRVQRTLDVLLLKHLLDIKVLLFIGVEVVKFIILVFTISYSTHSCAVFNRSVLLVGGLFNFAQISAISINKLFKAPLFLTYNFVGDEPMFFLRILAAGLLVVSEVFYIVAVYWYMNTLDNLIDGITSGLTLMVVSNMDSALYSLAPVDLIVHKTNPSKLKEYERVLEYGQIVVSVGLFVLLMIIAAAVAFSNHDDYDSEYC